MGAGGADQWQYPKESPVRATLHYLIAYAFLTYYGVEVCPYIESLGWWQTAINLAAFFAPALVLRHLCAKRILSRQALENWAAAIMKLDIALFLIVGAGITAFDAVWYRFPVGSGLKVVLGTATFGFFAGLDNYLAAERQAMRRIAAEPQYAGSVRRFFSLPAKFAAIATALALFVGSVLLLLVIKDFQWLATNVQAKGIVAARNSVVFEILFVFAVILIYSMQLIFSYAKNLKLYFAGETEVLERVADGDYGANVPVLSNDEFGMIAGHTNHMIEGLRERERIRHVFGKVVSPEIARRLVRSDGAITGRKQSLAILFADVRNFTGMSESVSGEELIRNLNRYLAEMVTIIRAHHGHVDKFIGDGILAVFGLEHEDHARAAAEALSCSHAMLQQVRKIAPELTLPFEIGIGIHAGDAIAGVIGSADRLEFTVIGDAVNTAARLEGLSKETGFPIVMSNELLADLASHPLRSNVEQIGEFALKGKTQMKLVFGLKVSSSPSVAL